LVIKILMHQIILIMFYLIFGSRWRPHGLLRDAGRVE
jgi:hypothetical protein